MSVNKYDYIAYDYKTVLAEVSMQCDKCGTEMINKDSNQGEWYRFKCKECGIEVTIDIKVKLE